MSNEKSGVVICAAATVEVVEGTPRFRKSHGFSPTIIDHGKGDFSFALAEAADPDCLAVSVVGHHYTFACIVAQVVDRNVRVRAFDAAAGDLDNVGFSLVVHRID